MNNSNLLLIILSFLLFSCERYPHTNPYDPEVSGSKYEVILSVSDFTIEEDIPDIATRYYNFVPILHNAGSYDANGVEVKLSESDPIMRLAYFTELAFPSIPPGESRPNDQFFLYEFVLTIPIDLPTPYSCDIFVEMSEDSHGPWIDTLTVTLQ